MGPLGREVPEAASALKMKEAKKKPQRGPLGVGMTGVSIFGRSARDTLAILPFRSLTSGGVALSTISAATDQASSPLPHRSCSQSVGIVPTVTCAHNCWRRRFNFSRLVMTALPLGRRSKSAVTFLQLRMFTKAPNFSLISGSSFNSSSGSRFTICRRLASSIASANCFRRPIKFC